MESKKGFTLVELLAVIIILALIALMASPVILGIIENSRQSSFASSMDGAKRAIENFYSTHYTEKGFDKNAKYKYESGRLYYEGKLEEGDLSGKTNPTIEMAGNLGSGTGEGMVIDGEVSFSIESNGFCGTINTNGVSVNKCSK